MGLDIEYRVFIKHCPIIDASGSLTLIEVIQTFYRVDVRSQGARDVGDESNGSESDLLTSAAVVPRHTFGDESLLYINGFITLVDVVGHVLLGLLCGRERMRVSGAEMNLCIGFNQSRGALFRDEVVHVDFLVIQEELAWDGEIIRFPDARPTRKSRCGDRLYAKLEESFSQSSARCDLRR